MPGLVDENGQSARRKRAESSQKSVKRARLASNNDDAQSRILLLENDIFESKKHYNNITQLLKLMRNVADEQEEATTASIALCRVFSKLIALGDLSIKKASKEKDVVVSQWLKERFSDFKSALLDLLKSIPSSTVLTLCMRTLRTEGAYLSSQGQYVFPKELLTQIVTVLLRLDDGDDLRAEFSQKFVEEYDDIRFYVFKCLELILQNCDPEQDPTITENALTILTAIETVPESKEEIEDFYLPAPKKDNHPLHVLVSHKKAAQNAWLAVLKMQMTKDQRKRVLSLVSSTIAPWFMEPEMLMDFLTDSYDAGGSTSLSALSGVFHLIQERNLDYPLFYPKLYSLLDAGILHSKHRSRFFRLLDTFMSSTHLPAVLVASFVKRLSRLALHAPPSGVVAVVPWIYNILKRHPTCTFMIHRAVSGSEAKAQLENEGLEDPYNFDEEDPMETKAIDSSLWELVTLQSHYHPNVATLAKIISEQFTKHAYNLEDFLDHSYGSMLDAELNKDVKKIPVIEYEIPKRILLKNDTESGGKDSLLVKLWDFR